MTIPGLKFRPSDEQLFTCYLIPKTHGRDTKPIAIGEVKLCQVEPWDLPDLCEIKSNDSVWHFFCPLEFKDPGRRVRNRKTRAGFWKPTGKPKPVYAKGTNKQIGLRTTLVFHRGTYKKNIKSNWYAYEYELITKGGLVLCKVELKPSKETSKRQPRKLQRTRKGPVSEQVPSSSSSSLDFEGKSSNSLTNNTTLLMNESPCVESEETDPAIFVSVNQMTRELSANSACTEIRPGQVLASGSENIHLGKIVVSSVHGEAEPTHQMDSDIGNQNSDSMKNYGSCDYNSEENHMLFLDFEGESSALSAFNFQSPYVIENISSSYMMEIQSDPSNVSSDCYYGETCGVTASGFENQDQDNGVLGILDFGNQNQDETIYISEGECLRANSACTETRPGQVLASGSENLHLGMAANSTCNASELSYLAFDNEIRSSSLSTTNSACDESIPNRPTNFDLGGQNSTETLVSSACNDGDPDYNSLPALENHAPNMLPTYYSRPMDHDSEDWISQSDIETSNPDFIIGSPYDKGEPCSLKALDFGDQNQDNYHDISGCKEGDHISPAAVKTPPNKENDISIPVENSSSYLNSLLNSLLADDYGLSKISPEQLTEQEAELEALIKLDSEINSINQPSCAPKEVLSAMAMDPFVPSGCLLWNSAIQ